MHMLDNSLKNNNNSLKILLSRTNLNCFRETENYRTVTLWDW